MIQSTRIPIIKRPQGYFLRWYYNGWHYWQFFTGALNYQTEGEKYRTRGTRNITASSGQLTESQAEAIRTILNTREVYLYSDAGWMAVKVDTGQAGIKNNETKGCEVVISLSIGSRMLSITGFSPVVDVPVIPPSVDQCEIVIGTQIWMCKNYDSNYPGSKVYNDDETNRALYGGLYTFDMARNPGFCPDGWRVPTEADWQQLIDFVGSSSAGILKETGLDYWNSPNTGAVDTYGFSARGGGYIDPFGVHSNLKNIGYFWTTSIGLEVYGKAILMMNNDATAMVDMIPPSVFASVRLIKIALAPVKYGYLYNWFAVTDARNIANTGWHVPTNSEIHDLIVYIDPDGTPTANTAAGELKETGLMYWQTPNTDALNSLGFNGRGAGKRNYLGVFNWITQWLQMWSSTEAVNTANAYRLAVGYNSDKVEIYWSGAGSEFVKNTGMSVRLVKDSTMLSHGQTGTYTGNDGRVYKTICIGTQEWLSENLCETKYRTGELITEVQDTTAWAALTTGARCSYDNDENNAVGAVKIIDGWFLPSKNELAAMYTELYLQGVGGFSSAGYWSSSEMTGAYDSIHNAWYQHFGTGIQNGQDKYSATPLSVRACRSFTSTIEYALRDKGPSGGLIFYKNGNDYLEAAPIDQSSASAFSNINNAAIGLTAQGTAIGTGQTNTAAIIAQAGHTASAAKVCDDLIIYK